jgi:hypothetical protein
MDPMEKKKVLRQKKSSIFFRYFETRVAQSSTFRWMERRMQVTDE